jgi:hypothetical protein
MFVLFTPVYFILAMDGSSGNPVIIAAARDQIKTDEFSHRNRPYWWSSNMVRLTTTARLPSLGG